jgi:protein-disulfide isomerase
MKRFAPFLIISLVLAAGLGAVWLLSRSSPPSNTPRNSPSPTQGPEPLGAQPPHIRGNGNAPVTVEEFADFQCGACGGYYPELKKIEAEYGERLRVVFRENPLVPMHQYGLVAAQAAEAAGLQGKFWEMHDKLFENQKAWAEAKDKDAAIAMFVDYAKQIGLNTDRFMRDLNGEAVAARIFQDGKRSHALNITSTPTFFVNGKQATGDQWKPDGLRQMINEALRAGQ